MNPTEVALIQISFHRISSNAEEAIALFYARLFELDPTLRVPLGDGLLGEDDTLWSMLGTAVASLENLDTLLLATRAFGARHGHLVPFEEYYASVGAALMWTLRKMLGHEFTPAVADAWSSAYSLLAYTVIDAQRGSRTAVAA